MHSHNEWVSKSNAIRDAGSPQDLITIFSRNPVPISSAVVPFAEGTKVLVYPVAEGTTVKNPITGLNEVVYSLVDINGIPIIDNMVGVIIIGKEQQKQTTFTSF